MISFTRSLWPSLEVGDSYLVWAAGCRSSRVAMLLGVDPDGSLLLALPPYTLRGRWRPWMLTRAEVRGVWEVTPS